MPDAPEFPDDAPATVTINYPGSWWNGDYGAEEKKAKRRAKNEIKGADIVAISDTDSDGLGCLAILEAAYDNLTVARVLSGHGGTHPDLTEALELVNEHSVEGVPVFISDICPNEEEMGEVLDKLYNVSGQLHVFDHHKWTDAMESHISDISDTFDVRSEQGYCAAQLVYEHVKDQIPDSEQEKYEELVAVTRDHDIWVKEDPRGDDLAELQFGLEEDEYIDCVRENGAAIMNDDKLREEILDARLEKEQFIEVGSKRADWVEIPIPEYDDSITVAFVYGTMYAGGAEVLYDGWKKWHTFDTEHGKFIPIFDHDDPNESDIYPGWKPLEGGYEKPDEHFPELGYSGSYFENVKGEHHQENINSDVTYENGDADVVVCLDPWNKASFRSANDYPICDIFASEVGEGGGHECAAGTQPNIVGKYYDVDIGVHWESEGRVSKIKLTERMEEALEDEEIRKEVIDRLENHEESESVEVENTETITSQIRSAVSGLLNKAT